MRQQAWIAILVATLLAVGPAVATVIEVDPTTEEKKKEEAEKEKAKKEAAKTDQAPQKAAATQACVPQNMVEKPANDLAVGTFEDIYKGGAVPLESTPPASADKNAKNKNKPADALWREVPE